MNDHTTHQPSVKLCECGCGNPTPIAKMTSKRSGYRKGDPMRFLPSHGSQVRIERTPPQKRFWAKVSKGSANECWQWTARTNRKGYGTFKVKNKTTLAHRFSYELHYGTIPAGLNCLHECDNPRCVNPAHLFLGTHKDNMNDCKQKGRKARMIGETNPSAKLVESDIVEIRVLAHDVVPAIIAERFGVSVSLVRQILRGEIWKHI